MYSRNKIVRRFLQGSLTCLLVVALSATALSQLAVAVPTPFSTDLSLTETWGKSDSQSASDNQLDSTFQAAQAVRAAMSASKANGSIMSYVAVMSKHNVVPSSPMTNARGAAGAALVGNRLIVRGQFRNLSSDLRDYASDPVNPPNTNITSAFHIHQGAPTENGPFQYALDVMMESDQRGRAMGEYMLTPEQLQALADGKLYVGLHTTKNRGGELRGILVPSS
ncbi:MAG: CHRD domain-containing protein [Phormidesmis sp.]